ncbi:hypothetical protein [Flavobacterium aestivum]|uniref:hypothetical protein n=1 Tax=Flavobacterium aestivum TaxID=3003257 RepID=UPI00228579F9|nr:hypothetical protein [Flavobacterium aestivum]
MKKVIIIVTLTLSLLSCSKNDDNNVSNPVEQQLTPNYTNIAGRWYYTSIVRPNGTTDPYVSSCSGKRDYADIFTYRKITKHRFFSDCDEGTTDCIDFYLNGITIKSCFEDFDNGRIIYLTPTTMKIEYDNVIYFGSIVGDGAKALILTK